MRPTLFLILPVLAACRDPAPAPDAAAPPPPRPVQVAEIRLSPAEASSAFTGTVRARREVEVGFRAGGRVVERRVEVGSVVAAGDILARLDPADLALSLRAAEADLASAEASARQAVNDAARSRSLLAAGHVAPAFDETRQTTARAAAERVASARASLDLARNRLSYATLVAPSAGVVTALLAEAGQVLSEGQPLLRLADPAERELVVRVPESALPTLRGAAAEAAFWARPGAPVAATLREVAPQADAVLRTYAVRYALPLAPDWVALGMTGTVRLVRASEAVATLPRSALHDRGEGPMVWRVTARGRLEPVPVRVRRLGDATAEVVGPLAEGERVVALGAQTLDAAQAVRVVDTRLAATLR